MYFAFLEAASQDAVLGKVRAEVQPESAQPLHEPESSDSEQSEAEEDQPKSKKPQRRNSTTLLGFC